MTRKPLVVGNWKMKAGAYTGDISGPMLTDLGCRYVLVGHSERRRHHHEDDHLINAKLAAPWPTI